MLFFYRTIHKLHRRWTFCENERTTETTTAAAATEVAVLAMAAEKNIKTTAKKRNTMISWSCHDTRPCARFYYRHMGELLPFGYRVALLIVLVFNMCTVCPFAVKEQKPTERKKKHRKNRESIINYTTFIAWELLYLHTTTIVYEH